MASPATSFPHHLLLILSLMSFMPMTLADSIKAATVCADPSPAGWKATSKVIGNPLGFSADIVQAAFDHMAKPVRFISDIPWKRCLHEVELGHIDFAMGAYLNDERIKIFTYSVHYNTLTPQIFFLRSKPLTVVHVSDLQRYRGCGLYGSSYQHYGLKSEQLDLGSGYDSLARKLQAGRCDYFVEELEIINSFDRAGKSILSDPEILHSDVSEAMAPSRYLVTAKNGSAAAMLKEINEALEVIVKSGQAAQIWKNQEGEITYKP